LYYGDKTSSLGFDIIMNRTQTVRNIEADLTATVITSERLRAEIATLLESQEAARWTLRLKRQVTGSTAAFH
jgi:hypothetical protein